MSVLRVEATMSGKTMVLGELGAGNQPGTISSEDILGRQVYLFGFIDGTPGVWRSIGGVDVEDHAAMTRKLHSSGLEPVGDLTAGPVEVTQRRPGRPEAIYRFTLA